MSATDPSKPLFNRRLLAGAIRGIDPRLDDEQRRIAASRSASAAEGSLLGRKERPLQAQFLSEVLGRLLGYHPLVGADGIHHMEPETSSKAFRGYRPPDAAVGSERLNPNWAVSRDVRDVGATSVAQSVSVRLKPPLVASPSYLLAAQSIDQVRLFALAAESLVEPPVLRLRLQELAPEGRALQQIKDRGYADKYAAEGVPIHLIGVEFSRDRRTLAGFEAESLPVR